VADDAARATSLIALASRSRSRADRLRTASILALVLSAAAIDLERLLVRIRALTTELLSMEEYARWGGGSDPAMNAMLESDGGKRAAERTALRDELETAARRADRATILAWADAHIALLEEQPALAAPWLEVKAGARAFVEDSVVYARFDPERYRSFFGFDPR
jgi:hypothetical protein